MKRKVRSSIPIPFTRQKRRKLEITPSSLSMDYEEVNFHTRECQNVVLLRGWYIPSKGSKYCIIIVHGLHANRAQPEVKLLEIAKALNGHGYNILTFDLRAHGESGGEHIWLGFYEAYDVLGAYDFLVNQKKILPENIGMLGFSYGAMAVILAVSKEKIAGAVVDSCPGDTLKLTKRWMAKLFIPPLLFYWAKRIVKKFCRIDVDELDTRKALKKITTPMFFIHGTDNDIPVEEIKELCLVKCNNPLDRLWLTAGVGHAGSYKTFPKEYIKKIIEFFNKTLRSVS